MDSFTYSLSNPAGTSIATVTVNVANLGFFVDTAEAQNGNGTQAMPFDNIADALALAGVGDSVVVRSPSTINGPINLPQGRRLIGEGSTLLAGQTILPAGRAPVITGPVVCGGNNEIRGFRIAGSAEDGVLAENIEDLTIRENTFEQPTERHIQMLNVGGRIEILDNIFLNTIDGPSNDYLDVEIGQDTTFNFDNNVVSFTGSYTLGELCHLRVLQGSTLNLNIRDNQMGSTDPTRSWSDGFQIEGGPQTSISLVFTGNIFDGCGEEVLQLDDDSLGSMDTVYELLISGNTISRCSEEGIQLFSGPTFNGRIFDNTISRCGEDSIQVDGLKSTSGLTIADNVCQDNGQDGVRVQYQMGGSGRVTISGNRISNVQDGINIVASEDSTPTVVASNNTISSVRENGFQLDFHGTSMGQLAL